MSIQEMQFNLEDLTKCYICMGKIIDATMCPNCQKLSCQKCIQKWLIERKNQCPHCRMPLKLTQIVNIRFMNDLSSIIETITSKKQNKDEMCTEHNINLLYFCNTCNESLCSDCYMFGHKHKDHDIQKLELIYKDHIDKIKRESKELQYKYEQLNNYLKLVNEKIIFVRNYKLERSNELEELFDNLRNKLENVIHGKLTKLMTSKNNITDKLKYLECIKNSIEKELNEAPKTHLIFKSEELVKNLKNMNIDSDIKGDDLNISLDIPSDIYPSYESAIFEIKDYKKLISSQKQIIIYSPELFTNGLKWRLKVYPNGNGANAVGEYISIFLELMDGLYETNKYYYKIELISIDKSKNNYSREFSSDFQNGECWGYNRFYRIESLEREGYIDNNGAVTLKYYVRPQTYSQLCKDQKNYIHMLEKKIAGFYNHPPQDLRTSEEIQMNNFNLINNLNNVEKEDIKKFEKVDLHEGKELNEIIEIEKKEQHDVEGDVIITEINFKDLTFIKRNLRENIQEEEKSDNKIVTIENNIPIKSTELKNLYNCLNDGFEAELSFGSNIDDKIKSEEYNFHKQHNQITEFSSDGSSFGSIMDSLKLIDDTSFNDKQHFVNLQKIRKAKDIFEDPNLKNKKIEKRSSLEKINDLFTNLYPENSFRLQNYKLNQKKYEKNKNAEFPIYNEGVYDDLGKLKNIFQRKKK